MPFNIPGTDAIGLSKQEREDLWALLYNFVSNLTGTHKDQNVTLDDFSAEMDNRLIRLERALRPEE